MTVFVPFLRRAACIAGSFLAVSAAAQPARVDLRPKFVTGHELRYRMSLHSTGTTSMPGLEDPLADPGAARPTTPKPSPKKPAAPVEPDQEMTKSADVRFRVVQVAPEGGATVEMIYDAIKLNSKSPLGDTVFDSSTPPSKDGDDPVAASLRKVVGTTLTLRIDRDGNITEVSGGESLLPGGMGGMGDAAALVSGSGVQQTWGPIFTGRKGSGEAAVGEKWTTTDSLNLSPLGAFTITTESVLSSARAGNADVDFKGRIEPSRESTRQGKGGEGVQIRSASHAGRYVWDTAAGALRSLTMKQTMEAGGTLGGMEMSTTQKSETRIERLAGGVSVPAEKPGDVLSRPFPKGR